jgi:MFS family permease
MSIFSLATLSSTLFEVPTGIFSDFLGRKRTIILGAFTSLASVFFYALGGAYLFLAVGAIFEGVAKSFFSGNNEAFLYETLAEEDQVEKYAEILGKTSSMFQLSAGIAAILGGLLGFYSFALVFWLSLVGQLICFILSFFFIEPKKIKRESTNIYSHLKEAFVNFKKNYRLRVISLVSILGYGIGETSWVFKSAFFQLIWPVWALGIATALANFGAAVSFFFAGPLIKKYGKFPLLIFASVYGEIIGYIAYLFPSVYSPVLLSTGSGFFGTNTVIVGSLMQDEFSGKQRATMGSLNSFISSLVFSIFAVILGAFADKYGPINALIFANILQIPNIYLWFRLKHSYQKTAGV